MEHKNNTRRRLLAAAGWLAAFLAWTAMVHGLDVRPIGPEGSSVGLAGWNGAFHRLTGVHLALYALTDWLSLIPVGLMLGFTLLGLIQLIRRRSLLRVDRSLLALGGTYALLAASYLLFERLVINVRPVLLDGQLEASYTSSTTLLVLTVMPTALLELEARPLRPMARKLLHWSGTVFTAAMVLGRAFSGVHWLTDLLGGALLSGSLVMIFRAESGR